MTKVSYFPRYAQRENFITNNTLLLLSRLHESNRRRFQSFLSRLLDDKADTPINQIGLQIVQQIGTGGSVVDGYLHQSAIRIAIETKRFSNQFFADQLLKHLQAFEPGASGYLLLLSPTTVDLGLEQWNPLQKEAKRRNAIVSSITFEQIIDNFRRCISEYDEEMQDLIDDFEAFCVEQELLDPNRHTIFVPPCGQSFDINIEYKLYFCPSSWSRRNAKYLGVYRNRSVQRIGIIQCIVQPTLNDNGELITLTENGQPFPLPQETEARIRGAIASAMHQNQWDISHGHKFFLCDELFETNFRKASSGGIMGHRYLFLKDYLPQELPVQELAEALRELYWE